MLRSRWEAVADARDEQRPPRRYYQITGAGAASASRRHRALSRTRRHAGAGPHRRPHDRPDPTGATCPAERSCGSALALPRSHRDEWLAEWLAGRVDVATRPRRDARRASRSVFACAASARSPTPCRSATGSSDGDDVDRTRILSDAALRRTLASTQAGIHRRRRRDARALHRREDRGLQRRQLGAVERTPLPATRPTRRRLVEQPAGEQRAQSGLRRRLLRLAGSGATRSRSSPAFSRRGTRSTPRPDGAERIDVGVVSANFLRMLARRPTIGRGFVEGEDRRGAAGTVILSHAFWSRALPRRSVGHRQIDHARRTAVHRDRRDGRSDFSFPESQGRRVAAALRARHVPRPPRSAHALGRRPIARRRLDRCRAARSDADRRAAQQEHPKEDGGLGITVLPLRRRSARRRASSHPRALRRRVRGAAHRLRQRDESHVRRAWSRRQELAVRSAMGAQPGAIVQQLLVESAVIALASAVLGSRNRRRRDARAVESHSVVDRANRPRRDRRRRCSPSRWS